MKALLVFDNVNDLVYWKWDGTFLEHVQQLLGPSQENDSKDGETGVYAVSQLLSPIVTSQRVMAAQFGNTYSAMQCKDGSNIVFDEWLDHVLVSISKEDVEELQRELEDCKTLMQHICGQNFHLVKQALEPSFLNPPITSKCRQWLSALLECRLAGDNIPGAMGVIGASGASGAALAALRSAAATHNLRALLQQHSHLLIYVGDKLLALYSSRGCVDLTPTDLILVSIECVAAQEVWERRPATCDSRSTHIPAPLPQNTATILDDEYSLPYASVDGAVLVNVSGGSMPSAPHALYLAPLARRITLAILVDMDLRELGSAVSLANSSLCGLQRLLLQRHLDQLPAAADVVEAAVKKITDALRRNKTNAPLVARLGAKVGELKKACSSSGPSTPETAASALSSAISAAEEKLHPEIPRLDLSDVLEELREDLSPYVEFLHVKAMRCFSLGSTEVISCSLTRHKYVEEFPGLVHFVLLDRRTGRYTAPDMADCADMLTRETFRSMLNRALRYAREGNTAATWRCGALHVCYALWWEVGGGGGGGAARPRALHPATVRALPPPGDCANNFYRQLTDLCFPPESGGPQASPKELVCVHLGLLPAATALQQARRLAQSVHDAAERAPHPAQLL